MRFYRFIGLWIVMLGLAALAGEVRPDEESRLTGGTWKMPSILPLSRIERLLDRVIARTYGVGFRYLGVEEDFFHGHLLFEERKTAAGHVLVPRAILYHTQEEGYAAHWEGTVDKRYDYLDVTTRNWLQWLDDDAGRDGAVIENARRYLDIKVKSPERFFEEGAAPRHGLYYTIHPNNLDAAKLGFRLYGELQFEFLRSDCASIGENALGYRRGPIRVHLGERDVCLKLSTLNPLIVRN